MADFRIKTSFFTHPKTHRITRSLGNEGVISLLNLWGFAAENRPDGILNGLDSEDIAFVSGWKGDVDKLITALVKAEWLHDDDGVLSIHDWAEHQPWVVGSKVRSSTARAAAASKWGTPAQAEGKANRSQRMAAARKLGTHTKQQWTEMVEFFGGSCVRCNGESGSDRIVKDHIIPIYQGGSDGIDNLQPLCSKCNSSKGPESKDFRGEAALCIDCAMPSGWVLNACEMPAETPPPIPSSPLLAPPIPKEPIESGFGFGEEEIGSAPTITLKDGTLYSPPLELFLKWEAAYPGIKVREEFPKMEAWLLSNLDKRKTRRGAPSFINGWLGRAKPSVKAPASKKEELAPELIEAFNEEF